MRVDAGFPKARGGSADGCGHAFASLGRWGDGGTLEGKRPPHKARSDNSKTEYRPARPCSKRRRGDALPTPFCCPSPKGMDLDLVAVFTRRAQDITASYANPKGREILPAHPLCIRRRYVGCRHTQQSGAADNALPGCRGRRCTSRLPLHQQPANGERLMA